MSALIAAAALVIAAVFFVRRTEGELELPSAFVVAAALVIASVFLCVASGCCDIY